MICRAQRADYSNQKQEARVHMMHALAKLRFRYARPISQRPTLRDMFDPSRSTQMNLCGGSLRIRPSQRVSRRVIGLFFLVETPNQSIQRSGRGWSLVSSNSARNFLPMRPNCLAFERSIANSLCAGDCTSPVPFMGERRTPRTVPNLD